MNLVQNSEINPQMSPFGFFPNMNLAAQGQGLPATEITEISATSQTNAKAMAS